MSVGSCPGRHRRRCRARAVLCGRRRREPSRPARQGIGPMEPPDYRWLYRRLALGWPLGQYQLAPGPGPGAPARHGLPAVGAVAFAGDARQPQAQGRLARTDQHRWGDGALFERREPRRQRLDLSAVPGASPVWRGAVRRACADRTQPSAADLPCCSVPPWLFRCGNRERHRV